jgi:hypothetical protein
MAGFVLAGEEAKNTFASAGKTVFTNIAVTGVNNDQVPGYIEFRDNTATTPVAYYLWVNSSGILMISSQIIVNNPGGTLTSPASVTPWADSSGTIVGVQT